MRGAGSTNALGWLAGRPVVFGSLYLGGESVAQAKREQRVKSLLRELLQVRETHAGRSRLRLAIAAAAAAVVALAATAPAHAGQSCPGSQIRTASGCTALGEAGKRVKQIVRETMAVEDLRAALVRVDVGNRTRRRSPQDGPPPRTTD
jgi:hypothetical protein